MDHDIQYDDNKGCLKRSAFTVFYSSGMSRAGSLRLRLTCAGAACTSGKHCDLCATAWKYGLWQTIRRKTTTDAWHDCYLLHSMLALNHRIVFCSVKVLVLIYQLCRSTIGSLYCYFCQELVVPKSDPPLHIFLHIQSKDKILLPVTSFSLMWFLDSIWIFMRSKETNCQQLPFSSGLMIFTFLVKNGKSGCYLNIIM